MIVNKYFRRTAMSEAAFNDVAAWVLLDLATALSDNGHCPLGLVMGVLLWVWLYPVLFTHCPTNLQMDGSGLP